MVDKVKEVEAQDEQEKPYDTSNPETVNTQRKKAARTRAVRLKFVQAAMDTVEGRAWFYDTLVRCHVFSTPFDADPYRHAYRAGEANIGLQILDDIQTVAPLAYNTMIGENKSQNG